MMKPVLVLQHLPDDGPAYLATWLEQQGVAMDLRGSVDRYPRDLSEHRALAVLGGEMSANDDLPALRRGETLIRDAMARGVPVIGHCLGGQLMARALGATVGSAAQQEIGWQRLEWHPKACEWFGDAVSQSATPEVFEWHRDAFELPPGAQWLAGNAACANQAFTIGHHLAMQFHIEVDQDKLAVWTREHDPVEYSKRGVDIGAIQSTIEIHREVAARLAAQQRLAACAYRRWLNGT